MSTKLSNPFSKTDDPVVIGSARRTPIGKFMGGLSTLSAARLGSIVLKDLLHSTDIASEDVSEVIMGHVLTAATGQNTARQAAIYAGIDESKTAFCINQVCGSGLRAIALGAQSLLLGESDIVLAGGHENMSLAPHATHLRSGHKMGSVSFTDTMIQDGLWDIFNDYQMGVTAENIAHRYEISRKDQDEFAVRSQKKAQEAIKAGKFKDEIVPVTVASRKGEEIVEIDEFPRADVTAEGLTGLKPAFQKDGTVTPGNASGLNDGAAAVVLMRASQAENRSIKPLARIASWATRGVDPSVMGTGPIPASRAALDKAGWSVNDLDLVESNEAFAAQSCCVIKELDLDPEIVNVNGGAIALGHPIGASGARVVTTLLHEMVRRDL